MCLYWWNDSPIQSKNIINFYFNKTIMATEETSKKILPCPAALGQTG
jgi:hypothetical protein